MARFEDAMRAHPASETILPTSLFPSISVNYYQLLSITINYYQLLSITINYYQVANRPWRHFWLVSDLIVIDNKFWFWV